MRAVTYGQAHAKAGLPFTVKELDRLPDDGRRYESLDGVLVVSPVRPRCTSSLTSGLAFRRTGSPARARHSRK